MIQKIYLASPRGFCAGVERAIEIVNLALARFDAPLWVNHEIVHNRTVVESFRSQGVTFSDNLEAIPEGAVYILSAHGTAPSFRRKAEQKNITLIDATCPLVTKVHWEAQKFHDDGYEIFYIGQKKHQEAIGVTDVAPMILIENESNIEQIMSSKYKEKKCVVLTQTTLSVDDTKILIEKLKTKIPHLREPGDLCYATQNRQDAVKVLAKKSDYIVVIGSSNSSNSNKMVVTSQKCDTDAKLYDTVEAIPEHIFEHKHLGLTSGASVPDSLVNQVIEKAKTKNPEVIIEVVLTKDESGLRFPLPPELK